MAPSSFEFKPVSKARYALSFAAVACLSFLLLAYVGYATYKQAESAAIANADNLASIAETRFDSTLRRVEASLDLLALNLHPGDLSGAKSESRDTHITGDLRVTVRYFAEIGQITAIDATGQVRYSSRPGELVNYGDRKWFKEIKTRTGPGLYFSDVIVGRLSAKPALIVARPLRGPRGEFIGVISASMDMQYFQSIFATLNLGSGGVMNIRRAEDGRLVVRWPEPQNAASAVVASTPLTRAYTSGETRGTYRFASMVDQVDRVWAFRRVADYPFVVVAGLDARDFLAPWNKTMQIVGVLLSISLMMLAGFLYFARRTRVRQLAASLEIANREARFRSLVDLSLDWYWEQDDQFRFVEVAKVDSDSAGLLTKDDLGKCLWELPGAQATPEAWSVHKAMLEARQPVRNFVYQRTTLAGGVVYISVNADPVFAADGSFSGYRGASRNVTAQYKMLESIVNTAMDGAITIDESHAIVLFNTAAENIFGYSAREVIGRPLDLLLPLEARAAHPRHIEEYARTGQGQRRMSSRRMVYGLRKNGMQFPLEASISSLATQSGRLMTVILRDVTERIAAEQALQEANDSLDRRVRIRTVELEQANRELEAFSYSVSHDLRAPLRAIDGYTSILKEELGEAAGPEAGRLMDKITAAAARMARLIDDVLEYGRATRGDLNRIDLDLDREIGDIVGELRMQYPRTRFELHRVGRAQCDPVMVRQILANLIGNACKYSAMREAPVVEVGCQTKNAASADAQSDPTTDTPEYFVRDNGVGFDMAHTAQLYGMFRRLHSDPSIAGNGVGLSIVKRLIERHGGHIEATAVPGEGATFRFSLGHAT